MEVKEKIIGDVLDSRRKYVQIEDYSALVESNTKARRTFIDYLANESRCSAIIFCNLSLPLRTAVKMNIAHNVTNIEILLARDYPQAIDMAEEICLREGLELDRVKSPLGHFPKTPSLFPVTVSMSRQVSKNRVYRVNNSILNYILGALIDEREISQCEEETVELMEATGQSIVDADFFLVDCRNVSKIHSTARRFAVQKIKNLLPPQKKTLVLVYNFNSRTTAFVRLITPLVSIPFQIAGSREEAFRIAFEKAENLKKKHHRRRKEKNNAMEQILNMAAEIKWDQAGLDQSFPDSQDPNLPYIKEIFSIIKDEVDYLFDEKKKTEDSLRETLKSLKEAQQKIVQNERFSALGQLSAGMAHHINNNLMIIQGYSDLLEVEGNMTDEQRDYLEKVNYSIERSAGITRKLLSFSRKQNLKMKKGNLNDFIIHSNFCEIHRRSGYQNLHLKTWDVPVFVRFDPVNLKTAIDSLVENAAQSMPGGGLIDLETGIKKIEGENECSFCSNAINGEWGFIRIKDQGVGMNNDELKRMFEPFFSTKECGSGLGLSQVSGIIALHNGHITVQSAPERGTDIIVYLPLMA